MDEVWGRAAVVVAAMAVVASFALLARRRRVAPRRLRRTGLDAGVYLFTSAGCGQCDEARRHLADLVGGGGFSEVAWEETPELFQRLRVDAVPATLIVAPEGSGKLTPGRPGPAALIL